jgi:hypothetical protein
MQYLFHKFYLKPVGRCNRRFGTVLAIFKDSYRALRITSTTLTPPLLTVLTRKTDHVCVPGVDDMTVAEVQGSGFRGSGFRGSGFKGSGLKGSGVQGSEVQGSEVQGFRVQRRRWLRSGQPNRKRY